MSIIGLSLMVCACSTSHVQSVSSPPSPVKPSMPTAQMAFVQQMADQYHMNPDAVDIILRQAVVQPVIISQMNRPNEALPWYRYQALFVNELTIQQGQTFLEENHATFRRAQKQYGVPPTVVAAILGVETRYGRNQGGIRALDALYTLSFDYPRRGAYFQGELAQYLLLCQEYRFNPLTVKSSYAGALGMPQFMPTAYRVYAVAAQAEASPNLFDNQADVILSVSHYFAEMGWRAGAPIAVKARLSSSAALTSAVFNGNLTLGELKRHGIHAEHPMSSRLQANLLLLEGPNHQQEAFLVFHNFYVIKRYNASNLYAMAVFQLSQKI